MSFSLLEDYCAVLNKYLKFASFELVSFYDGFWDSNCINPRWLFDKLSLHQRSHLRNAYIQGSINSFYVDSNVAMAGLH